MSIQGSMDLVGEYEYDFSSADESVVMNPVVMNLRKMI